MVSLGKRSEGNKFLEPIDPLGGQLYLVKTIIYYDMPLLFVCQNDAGELFLFNEIKDERSRLEWGVIDIDTDSLEKFIKGEISFRELYLTCEDSYIIVGAIIGETDDSVEVYIDSDDGASDSYQEMLDFYNDDRKLSRCVYDDIGEN